MVMVKIEAAASVRCQYLSVHGTTSVRSEVPMAMSCGTCSSYYTTRRHITENRNCRVGGTLYCEVMVDGPGNSSVLHPVSAKFRADM